MDSQSPIACLSCAGVPYRLIASVVALVPEGLLIEIDEVPMGPKQVKIVVKLHSMCHVVRNEIIKATQSSRKSGFICLWRQLHQALHCRNILLSLRFGEIAPVSEPVSMVAG